eukprot:TRINITY_DN49566_c0_g1_i1.p1 TRINITY_DN49566_c0_g1~~TRINITY_DN49566_c0_g1_i1.p1  ORF type:complete len:491 (+),score=91.36 TRINITY_DN49566_c0_g1_i1:107-1579(+)
MGPLAPASDVVVGQGLLVEESFLLRVLRDVVDRRILAGEGGCRKSLTSQELAANDDLLGRLEGLWDLCVDSATAAFLTQNRAVAILTTAAAKAGAAIQSAVADDASTDVRCAEIFLGTLANICSHSKVVATFGEDDLSTLQASALESIASVHGVVVVQALRLAFALLCGPAASVSMGQCVSLRSEQSLIRILFVLENSLLWEAVQKACDTLNQILMVEHAAGNADRDAAFDEQTRTSRTESPTALTLQFLVQKDLPSLLASRLAELVVSAAGGSRMAEAMQEPRVEGVGNSDDGEGDVEAAILSMLCLADTFLSVVPCESDAVLVATPPLASASLRVLAVAGRSEVLAAALGLLASLLEMEEQVTPSCRAGADGSAHPTPFASDPLPIASACFSFARSAESASLVEKLVLLLEEGSVEDVAISGALAVLQHAPRHLVAVHEEQLRTVVCAHVATEGLTGLRPGLSPEFLQRLGFSSDAPSDPSAESDSRR